MNAKIVMWVGFALIFNFIGSASAKAFKRVSDTRPEIWIKNSGKRTMAAEEMARLDAASKIVAFIRGVRITENVTIGSFEGDNKNITASIEGVVKFAKEGEFVYFDEGICTLEVTVDYADIYKLTKVIQKQYYKSCEKCDGQSDIVTAIGVKRFSLNKNLKVIGIGGIVGTGARELARGIRAAEVDAYAKYAAFIEGLSVGRETKIADFVNVSDTLKSEVEGIAKGVKFELPELYENSERGVTKASVIGVANFKNDIEVIKLAIKVVLGKMKNNKSDLNKTLKEVLDTGEMEKYLEQAVGKVGKIVKVTGTYDFTATEEVAEEKVESVTEMDGMKEVDIEVLESSEPVFVIE